MAAVCPRNAFFLLSFLFTFCLTLAQQIEPKHLLPNEEEATMVTSRRSSLGACDFSVGKWVYDASYPLYDIACPYITTRSRCQGNGRPDSDYEKWKWKPQGCSIPRFNALAFLGKMRRKRIMLVGDSIMRSQWESLVCLVQGVVPANRKMVTFKGPTKAFHALDFETSIEFHWAPFLVELYREPSGTSVLHLDMIEDNAKYWRDADVLVFDSAHWWLHSGTKTPWDYMMDRNVLFRSMNPMLAYEKGLTTWARWVDLNLNRMRTRVIFRSYSPMHSGVDGTNCYKRRTPLAYPSQQHVFPPLVVQQEVLRRMKFPVYLLNITTMSALRRDGHPSVYQMAPNVNNNNDCSHWCLPGVPDIWNEMLSALL